MVGKWYDICMYVYMPFICLEFWVYEKCSIHKLMDVIIIDKEGVNISFRNDVETSSGGFTD